MVVASGQTERVTNAVTSHAIPSHLATVARFRLTNAWRSGADGSVARVEE